MGNGEVEPWCPTKVDESGYKIDGAFVYCKDGCPKNKGYLEWVAAQKKRKLESDPDC